MKGDLNIKKVAKTETKDYNENDAITECIIQTSHPGPPNMSNCSITRHGFLQLHQQHPDPSTVSYSLPLCSDLRFFDSNFLTQA